MLCEIGAVVFVVVCAKANNRCCCCCCVVCESNQLALLFLLLLLFEISIIGNFAGSHSVRRFAGAVEVSFGAGIDASSSGWRVCAHEGAAAILQPCLADSARRSDALGMIGRKNERKKKKNVSISKVLFLFATCFPNMTCAKFVV